MPLEFAIPLIFGAVALMTGFFFVRAKGPDYFITMFGTFTRATQPVPYWFWWLYYYGSLAFIALVLIGIIFGLMT